MMEWKDVHSDVVEQIKYNDNTEELFVKWRRGGRVSIYDDVPADIANQAMTAWSVGKFLDEKVKPVYQHRYGK